MTLARDALTRLGLLFFLFAVGLETDLSLLRRFRRQALCLGLSGSLLPLLFGAALVAALPRDFWGPQAEAHPFAFTLFVGLNLANSAIPVLARILMDLRLLGGRIGTLCIAAAVVDDLVAWAFFAVVLVGLSPTQGGLGRPAARRSPSRSCCRWRWWPRPPLRPAGAFVAQAPPAVAGGLHRRHGRCCCWPPRRLPKAAGVHAALGALLLGVALGGGRCRAPEAHDVVARFALGLFAPLYFVSLGLTTDFVRSFDAALVAVVVAAAIVSKLSACCSARSSPACAADRDAVGDRLRPECPRRDGDHPGGRRPRRRGDRRPLFVALAVMAFLTSLLAGPAMSRLLRPAAQSDL